MAHVISSAYVKSRTASAYQGFTAGSFQDMTRIAGVDENMWSELYMLNRSNLLSELDSLLEHLSDCRLALASGDEERLRRELREGRILRESIRHFPE